MSPVAPPEVTLQNMCGLLWFDLLQVHLGEDVQRDRSFR